MHVEVHTNPRTRAFMWICALLSQPPSQVVEIPVVIAAV